MTMPLTTISVMSTPSTSSRFSDGLPFPRNLSDFEVEHNMAKTPVTPTKGRRRKMSSDYDAEAAYHAHVARLIAAKARPFCVAGRIPVDPINLILFFRSKSGITHSLDFPIDIDYDLPPALDVLIAACTPQISTNPEGLIAPESLSYPANFPLTTTLEIANHPILDALRNTLFPSLPTGHYLTAVRDRLEVRLKGTTIVNVPRPIDNRVATIVVTLPVRFRGGALVVRNKECVEEKFYGRGGKSGDMEWAAYMSDCDCAVEPVTKGCKISISYAVQLRSFGPSGLQPDPLISPSDQFLDLLSPVLNMSRGRKIAFYLTGEYGINPSEVLAESLVPHLKGGDSVLYHAIKLFKLSPELRWTAGGYIWPVDQTVEFDNDVDEATSAVGGGRVSFSVNGSVNGNRNVPAMRGPFSVTPPPDEDDTEDLRTRVEKSGAVPLSEAEIVLLSDPSFLGPISKQRVHFVSGDGLEKLVINVLLVVFIP